MTRADLALIYQGIQLATAAANLVPRALAAVKTVDQILAEGRDPTSAEWAELNEVSDVLHGRLQAAAGREGGGA